jgi:uncharacterized membrane protein
MDVSAQLVALASTAVYAAGNLYARVGLIHSTPLVVTLISLIVQTVVVWTLLLARGSVPSADPRALAVFIAVGIALPGALAELHRHRPHRFGALVLPCVLTIRSSAPPWP